MRRQENATWWQWDREISPEDITYRRTLSKRFPGLSRTELICTLCEHLDWLTPAGGRSSRSAPSCWHAWRRPRNCICPCCRKTNAIPAPGPAQRNARSDPRVPLAHALSELDRARLRLVSGTQEEHLWNAQVERYHPLGYKKPFGYGARYFIESGEYQLGWPFHAVAASWSNKRSIERLGTLLALIDQVRDKDTAVAILESLLRFCVQGTQRIEESDLRGLLQQSTNTGDPIMQTFVGRYIEQVVQQGEAAMLPRLIEHRLGPPSDQVRERVTQADPNALLQWSERLLDANSLDEVLH